MDESLLELRKKYRGYMPENLAQVRGEEMLYEFISWPWREADGRVLINVRPVNQPADMRTLEARKQVSAIGWNYLRQKAYKEGFASGIEWAMREQRKLVEQARRDGWLAGERSGHDCPRGEGG